MSRAVRLTIVEESKEDNMKKHLGSTIALVIGVLFFISGLIQPTNNLIRGIIITFGALAYRSAKKQKLGEVRVSLLRKTLELFLIVIIIAAVLLQNNLSYKIETYPVDNLIIPLWAIIAYLVIAFKKYRNEK